MIDCKNLKIEDVTPWHSDVFDHPDYKYTCKLIDKEIVPCIHCNNKRCKHYESLVDDVDVVEAAYFLGKLGIAVKTEYDTYRSTYDVLKDINNAISRFKNKAF